MMVSCGSTLGFIGGGQLARMMAIAAANLGYKTLILDPDPDCPAAQVTNKILVAPYDDGSALNVLADTSCVVTYEFENVPSDSLVHLAQKVPVYPPPRALQISQDRVFEKQFLNEISLKAAEFCEVNSEYDLVEGMNRFGGKGVLKTRRMGYDGRGQVIVHSHENLEKIYSFFKGAPLILESWVPFQCEISVIAVRSIEGSLVSYEPSENTHQDGILRRSKIPASVSSYTAHKASEAAFKILEALEYVGVSGVEFFVLSDGEIMVNEFAPRVHNSGHWTEAACVVSQFEQHIRAICGLELGSALRHSSCVMENIIGNEITDFMKLLAEPDVLIRLYGKKDIRNNRKMGHFTRIIRDS